jgi:CRP/FNR family transcriptional regulator, cyclic AMP receptor protein
MEIVGRMMDSSISYPPNEPRETPIVLGPKVGQDQKMGYLERVPVLESCSKRQLRAISRIAAVLETPAGQVLARVGEPGDHFFFIIDGAARAEVPPQSHHRVGPGEFFGEMSLLDGGPRSATVVADTPIRLLVVHRRDFWKLLKEAPGLTEQILVTLSRRVRRIEKAVNA